MSIFDRVVRLAKSNLNHLADEIGQRARARSQSQPREEEVETGPRPSSQPSGAGGRYPKDVRDAYAALELPLGSDREAVKKAYRELLRRYHPDKHQADAARAGVATELTRQLTEAQARVLAWLDAQGR